MADAVSNSLRNPDGKDYRLDAYSVMSNHVHAVFQPFLSEKELHETIGDDGRVIWSNDCPGLSRIMHGVKGSSARECNLILSRTGQFGSMRASTISFERENSTKLLSMSLTIRSRLGW